MNWTSCAPRMRVLRGGKAKVENDFGDFSPVFVFAAYAIVWVAFFAYLYFLARRQADITSQIDALKESTSSENDTDRE